MRRVASNENVHFRPPKLLERPEIAPIAAPTAAADAPPAHADPFAGLALSPFTALESAPRVSCPGCGKSRRYYCGACGSLVLSAGVASPRLTLPLRFEVVQGRGEPPQKSTAGQAAALAPDSVRVWPADRLDALAKTVALNAPDVALLYPRADAPLLADMPSVQTLVVLDASWTSASVMAEAPPFRDMRCVRLESPSRRSAFWRYPPARGERSAFNPDAIRAMLSTVEAVHECCVQAAPDRPGGFDDLLWLFAFQHGRVKAAIDADPAKRARLVRKSKGVLADRF